jgi:hemoglobin-like flavoprotein
MELEVTPPVDDALVRALADVLAEEQATVPVAAAWQRAALAESVEGDERYAFSPRSTRGATRA